MPSESSITVRWVKSADQIPAGLWEACFRPPLEGRWLYRALDQSGLEEQIQFAYLLIERDGTAVGIAPTFQMDLPLDIIVPDQLAGAMRFIGRYIPFMRFQRTLFVGSPCTDEGTVGLSGEMRLDDVVTPIQKTLVERARRIGASMIVWKDFVEADVPALSELARDRGLFQVTSYPGTRLKLAEGGFENYLAALKGSRRHNLKKKLRQGKEVLAAQSSVIQHPDGKTLDEIFGLFWQTYLKGKTKFEKLNRRFFELIAAEPTSYFVILRARGDAKMVAFMLCFDCGMRVVNKYLGIDYSIEDSYLYFQLWEAAVDWASRRGFREFQSGQTVYRAKLDVGHELVPLHNFCRHRNPLVHKVFASQARGITWDTIDEDLAVRGKSPARPSAADLSRDRGGETKSI